MKLKMSALEADYQAALKRIDKLMDGDPEPLSPAGEELELLGMLVERYEREVSAGFVLIRFRPSGFTWINRIEEQWAI